jgi:hypothetical protein
MHVRGVTCQGKKTGLCSASPVHDVRSRSAGAHAGRGCAMLIHMAGATSAQGVGSDT